MGLLCFLGCAIVLVFRLILMMGSVMEHPLIDCHTHTHHSDGTGALAENVAFAASLGCKRVALTDHLTLPASMDPAEEVQVPREDLAAYAADIARVREEHPEVELVFGFECDWYEGCEENVRRWSEGATFRLGSVHWVDGHWIDDSDDRTIWEQLGADQVWRRYVDLWCRACESPLAFDSMAHPDLALRFVNEGFAPTIDLLPLFGQMAECAHDTGRHVEVSTAGLRKSVRGYYPCPQLLDRFFRAGVPITFGSDAHVPHDVCWGIRDAYAYAHAIGYRGFDAPTVDGGWETFEL